MDSGRAAPSRSFVAALALAAAGLASAACASTLPADAEAVAVLVNHTRVEQDGPVDLDAGDDTADVEACYAECVRDAVEDADLPLRVIDAEEFRRRAFPDLDPRAAPRGEDAVRTLAGSAAFRDRVLERHVRWIAVIGGRTRTSERKGGIAVAGGYGGAAAFGAVWWDHETRLGAVVFDLRLGLERAADETTTTGTSWVAVLGVLPVGMPSSHEAAACERVGRAVAAALGAGAPPPQQQPGEGR